MCGEDGAQREVYKLKEEHEKGGIEEKKEKEKKNKNGHKRERRKQEGRGRVVLVTKEKRSLDRLKTLNGLEGKSWREIPQLT